MTSTVNVPQKLFTCQSKTNSQNPKEEINVELSTESTSNMENRMLALAMPEEDESSMDVKPACPYWHSCYRRNEMHLAAFRHPDGHRPAEAASGSGSALSPVDLEGSEFVRPGSAAGGFTGHHLHSQADRGRNSSSSSSTSSRARSGPAVLDPRVFYLTYIPSCPETGSEECVSIQDLFDAAHDGPLERVLFTTYKLDLLWLWTVVRSIRNVPTDVCHGERGAPPFDTLPSSVRIWAPEMRMPYGVNHGKLILMQYPTQLRVVVTTGNLISVDWERKTNAIWTQIFPRRSSNPSAATTSSSPLSNRPRDVDFGRLLLDYATRLGATSWQSVISATDFSNSHAALLTTVPGYFSGPRLHDHGHMRLGALLRKWYTPGTSSHRLVGQFSSVGMIGQDWIDEWSESLSGEQGSTKKELDSNNFQNGNEKEKEKQKGKDKNDSNCLPVDLVWPTAEFVQRSIDGESAGDSLCLSQRNARPCFTSRLHRYEAFQASRRRVPPHIKTYFRIDPPQSDQDRVPLEWVAVTSANLSRAAWGAIVRGGGRGFPRGRGGSVSAMPGRGRGMGSSPDSAEPGRSVTSLRASNFEIGVLLLPALIGAPLFGGRVPSVASSACTVPLAFAPHLSARRYSLTDRPWMWDLGEEGEGNVPSLGKRKQEDRNDGVNFISDD